MASILPATGTSVAVWLSTTTMSYLPSSFSFHCPPTSGVLQRLARALATNPRLLLLDEIAGGLTEGECSELVETIRGIHRSGRTIVWIEHIVHALVAVVGRLVVLNFGKLIAEGRPDDVLAMPQVRETYLGSPV